MQTEQFNIGTILAGVLIIILLMVYPLMTVKNTEFGGSDGLGSDTVAEIAPNYDSEWVSNIWEPPGGETESMLFALQATAGGVLIGYAFGYLRGKKSVISHR
ncbi:MAG: energy-coupling factor ABC transporter substrate-binding protein [Candidatus Promineifilaceae bacterium]